MASQKEAAFLSLLVLLIGWGFSCKKETAVIYPVPAPNGRLASFLPGVVSSDSFEFNALYAPDGRTFYFSREDIHNIYQTTFNGTSWSTPMLTSFSEVDYKECDPAFSPEGTKLFYISTRPTSPVDSTDDFNIWYVERQDHGWSMPMNLEVVNSDSNEFYVSFAGNGNLYFASNRADSYGMHDVYVSRLVNGVYTSPVNLGSTINTGQMEHDPFVSKDERLLIFTAVNRADGLGRGDLYFSVRDETGNWSIARNLGAPFNTTDYDFCAYISPDEEYFFYSDNKDIKWINIEELNRAVGRR